MGTPSQQPAWPRGLVLEISSPWEVLMEASPNLGACFRKETPASLEQWGGAVGA